MHNQASDTLNPMMSDDFSPHFEEAKDSSAKEPEEHMEFPHLDPVKQDSTPLSQVEEEEYDSEDFEDKQAQ